MTKSTNNFNLRLLDSLQELRRLQELEKSTGKHGDSILEIAHSLAGSAGTFGYPEISKIALELEECSDGLFSAKLGKLMQCMEKTLCPATRKIDVLAIFPERNRIEELKKEFANKAGPYNIESCETLGSARVIIEKTSFDLIILDADIDMKQSPLFLEWISKKKNNYSYFFVCSMFPRSMFNGEFEQTQITEFFEAPYSWEDLVTKAISHLYHEQNEQPSSFHPPQKKNGMLELEELWDHVRSDSKNSLKTTMGLLSIDQIAQINRENLPELEHNLLNGLRRQDFLCKQEPGLYWVIMPDLDLVSAIHLLKSLQGNFKNQGKSETLSFTASLEEINPYDPQTCIPKLQSLIKTGKIRGGDRILPDTPFQQKSKPRVLVVEDDELTARFIKQRLECRGYEVALAPDGVKGLKAARELHYNLIILDVKLPHLNGFETLIQIKKNKSYQHTPILMLTAKRNQNDVQKGISLGADDYMLKPFHPDELLKRISQLIGKNAKNNQDLPS